MDLLLYNSFYAPIPNTQSNTCHIQPQIQLMSDAAMLGAEGHQGHFGVQWHVDMQPEIKPPVDEQQSTSWAIAANPVSTLWASHIIIKSSKHQCPVLQVQICVCNMGANKNDSSNPAQTYCAFTTCSRVAILRFMHRGSRKQTTAELLWKLEMS